MNALQELAILSSTGLIFVVAGYIMLKYPPKERNALYGYRTPSLQKSVERWFFSQKYATKKNDYNRSHNDCDFFSFNFFRFQY